MDVAQILMVNVFPYPATFNSVKLTYTGNNTLNNTYNTANRRDL